MNVTVASRWKPRAQWIRTEARNFPELVALVPNDPAVLNDPDVCRAVLASMAVAAPDVVRNRFPEDPA